jgi:hypothetical protein
MSVLISPFYINATTSGIDGVQGLVSSIHVTNTNSINPNLFLQNVFSAGSIVILYNVSNVSTYFSILANSAVNATAGPSTQSINPNACTILTASMIDSNDNKNIQWTTLCTNRSIGGIPQGSSPANVFLPLVSKNKTSSDSKKNIVLNESGTSLGGGTEALIVGNFPNSGTLFTLLNLTDTETQFTGDEVQNFINGVHEFTFYPKSSESFLNIYKDILEYSSHWVKISENVSGFNIVETFNYSSYIAVSNLVADAFVSYDPSAHNDELPENSILRLVSIPSEFNIIWSGCPYLQGKNQPGSITVFYNQTTSLLYVANPGYINDSQNTVSVSPSCCLILICIFDDGTKYHWVSLANNAPF